MRESLLRSLAWLHTWCGLLVGWLLLSICITGSLAVFHDEIDRWMRPEVPSTAAPARQAVATAERHLRQHHPDAALWSIALEDGGPEIAWNGAGGAGEALLHPVSGMILTPRETEGGHFLVEVHYSFHAGTVGIWLVAAAGIGMLVAVVGGVLIHKRIFRDFFTFRPKASPQRRWLDAHNVLGVLALPFHLMIAYTGLMATVWTYMPAAFDTLYPGNLSTYFAEFAGVRPPPPEPARAPLVPFAPLLAMAEDRFGPGTVDSILVFNPGRANAAVHMLRRVDDRLSLAADRIVFDGTNGAVREVVDTHSTIHSAYTIMAGLHYARYGGAGVRWLYFILGIGSALMVLTGLIVFTEKRRRRSSAMFDAVASRLHVAATFGIPLATAIYLLANRLLPVEMTDRGEAERLAFFAAWLGSLIHALARPPEQGWRDQAIAGAILFLAVPILNGLTTKTHLVASIAAGDWGRAAIDLTCFVTAVILVAIGYRLHGRKVHRHAVA